MTRDIDAVLLDLDGTLLDHEEAARTAFLAACAQWFPGLDAPGRDRALRVWRELEATAVRAFLDGTLTFQEQRRVRVRGVLAAVGGDSGIGDARADDLFTIYLRRYETGWAAFADVAPAMALLRGLPGGVAILSNGDRAQQEAKVDALALDPRPRLFVPADVGAAKPAPESFLRACAAMGWEPARVLYVGDHLETDALAAARAGLIGCWLDRCPAGDRPLLPQHGPLPPHVLRITGLSALAAVLGPAHGSPSEHLTPVPLSLPPRRG